MESYLGNHATAPVAPSTPQPAKLVRPWECSPTKPKRSAVHTSPVNSSAIPASPALHQIATPAYSHLAANSRNSSPYCQLPDQLQHTIISRQTALLQKLGELCQTVPATWPTQLYQGYQMSVKALLDDRQRAFLMNQPIQTFDHKHLCLIESTFQQIQGLSQMSITVSTATPTCSTPNSAPTHAPSPVTTPLNPALNDSGYNSAHSTPNSLSPQPGSPATPNTTPITSRAAARRGRFLNNVAVQLMEEWYRVNFDHPYPTDAVVQQLAGLGNITTNQVKKWMANKRVRSCNTLSFNGSIHPKKLKRLQRQMAQQSTGVAPQSHLVDSRALNEWASSHPYAPNSEEKRRLANETGLSLPQIKSWFANRRYQEPRGSYQQSEYALQVPADYYSHVDPSLPLL